MGQKLSEYLPPRKEQKHLLDGLAKLIALRGHETFVSAPLLRPDNACFPDPWAPNAEGVRILCQRLMTYAGLGHLKAEVDLLLPSEPQDPADRACGRGVAAWFLGIEGDRCLFGADAEMLPGPENIVAALCHEVAHAYRLFHGLVQPDSREEERLTDLTTIYLGFGILTANASFLYRSSGDMVTYVVTAGSQGYLSPQAMSFLLAAQAVARGLGAAERRRLCADLETTQAAHFHAAWKALDAAPEGLLQRLGLPDRRTWPAPASVPACAPSLLDSAPPAPSAQPLAFNEGRPVFRVRERRTSLRRLCLLASLVGLLYYGLARPEHRMAILFAALSALLLVVEILRRGRLQDACSDPRCKAPLPAGARTCPGCGGTIAGMIRHRDQRLQAEESLQDSAPQRMPPAEDESQNQRSAPVP